MVRLAPCLPVLLLIALMAPLAPHDPAAAQSPQSQPAAGVPVLADQTLTWAQQLLRESMLVGAPGNREKWQDVLRLTTAVLQQQGLSTAQRAQALALRARARNRLGERDGAWQDVRQALRLMPSNYDALVSRGNLQSDPEAIASYSEAIRVRSGDFLAYMNRSMARLALDQAKTALADADWAVSLAPQVADVYVTRAMIRGALGDETGAVADASRALALSPRDHEAYDVRGFARTGLGDFPAALADLDAALRLWPDFTNARNNRCWLNYRWGRYAAALPDCDRALALDPEFRDAYDSRGRVRLALGDVAGGCRDLRLSLQLGNPETRRDFAGPLGRTCAGVH
ncbi:MAG: hypothetical protein RLZZ516_1885 [Cyanobacteriota bacterium]|jgi:tetratricopeptide (TPR) repeat protein